MKCGKYVSLHEYIQATSGASFNTVDNLLSKLEGKDFSDLQEILIAFYEDGKESGSFQKKYDEGYADGWLDAKGLYENS